MSRRQGRPPPRSAKKDEFLAYLGLNDHEHSHKMLYRKMLDEAGAGRDRLSQDPNNLYPMHRVDVNLRQPYSADMMTETAMHREVMNIWKLASNETKSYYNYGHTQSTANVDNWVIRWLVWHAFRYRDNRNNRASTTPEEPTNVYGQRVSAVSGQGGVYWDPIRN